MRSERKLKVKKADISDIKISEDGFMDVTNAGRYIGYTRYSIYKQIRSGKAAKSIKRSGKTFFHQNDLDEWLSERVVPEDDGI